MTKIKENPENEKIIARLIWDYKSKNIDMFLNDKETGARSIDGIEESGIDEVSISGTLLYGTRIEYEEPRLKFIPYLEFAGTYTVEYFDDDIKRDVYTKPLEVLITECEVTLDKDGEVNINELMFYYNSQTKTLTIS